MIGETYFLKDFPVGTKVVMKSFYRSDESINRTFRTYHVGVIQSYDAPPAYAPARLHTVNVLWDNGYEVTVALFNMIRYEDVGAFKQEQQEFHAIKVAIAKSYIQDNFSVADWLRMPKSWVELDMDFERKIALINACVTSNNIHLYDTLTTDELKSLKNYVRAMEGVEQ